MVRCQITLQHFVTNPLNTFLILRLKSPFWLDVFRIHCFWSSPNGSSQVLLKHPTVSECRKITWPLSDPYYLPPPCTMMFRTNAYTAQISMKAPSTTLPEDTSVLSRTSNGPFTRVTQQCQTTSLAATSKVMYTKHVLSIGDLKTDNFHCTQRIPKEFCVLWYLFHHDCRSVMKDMLVTYIVPYSNSNY